MVKVDLRRKIHKEIIRLFFFSGLTPEELFYFIRDNSIEDIKRFLDISDITIDYIKSLNLSSFMSYFYKFITNKHKYYKRSKFAKNLIKEVRI